MSGRGKLGFRFGPVPEWVFERYTRGELSERRFVVLAFLFRLANGRLLAERGETPRLSLDRLGEAIRWPHAPESLSRLLGRMRADGLLGYRVTGNPKTGYRYLFRLYPDGPAASDLCPTSQSLSQSQEAGSSEEAASADTRPTSTRPRPTSDDPSNPHEEQDREPAAQGPSPTSLDVRDEDKPLAYGTEDGKPSSSRVPAHVSESAVDSNAQADQFDFAARADAAIRQRGALNLEAEADPWPLAWPEHGLDGEAAILADLSALVIAGLAEPVDRPAEEGERR